MIIFFQCFLSHFKIIYGCYIVNTNTICPVVLPTSCGTVIVMKISEELQKRGFIHQFSASSLAEILDQDPKVIYHGIDPSADSAHAGNFVNWMLLYHLAKAGHKIIFLVGGGTGRIGDPKPDVERNLKSAEEIDSNVAKLRTQAERLLAGHDITFVNNYEWLGELRLVEFLRDIGKHFTVNELIKKDAIATRLASEQGLSYTEFAYPLLQGFDYLELFRRHNCTVQVGGSDQWGNMVAGIDLIRRLEQTSAHVVTVPLVVDKVTGKKFGKSEGNAVWLDSDKTSPYAFYQFWYNTSDENVADYLKLFTTIPTTTIEEHLSAHLKAPEQRTAQKILAEAVTSFVHGVEAAEAVTVVSSVLFDEVKLADVSDEKLNQIKQYAPLVELANGLLLIEALVASGLADSKREARTFVESGAVSVQHKKVTDSQIVLHTSEYGSLIHLRRGKKHVALISLIT